MNRRIEAQPSALFAQQGGQPTHERFDLRLFAEPDLLRDLEERDRADQVRVGRLIAARAGFDRRSSPRLQARRGCRAGPPSPAALPQVEVALLHRLEKVGAGTELALEQTDLERAPGDRDEPDNRFAALG